MNIEMNMIETTAIAVAVYYFGKFIKKNIMFFERFCIPAPVIGGLIFSLIVFAGHVTGIFSLNLDNTLQDIFMTAFFTTIGYSASLKFLKKGSRTITILVVVTVVLILFQDAISFALSPVFGINPLLGLCSGSISMIGGHGTSAAWGPILEKAGVFGATGVAIASATFGLVLGGMIGGPIGKRLIIKNNLCPQKEETTNENIGEMQEQNGITKDNLALGIYQIIISMGIGSLLSFALQSVGLLFPYYVGALIVAVILRNIADFSGKFKIRTTETDAIGQVCLILFLVMALMSLKLWEIAMLAVPMIAILIFQTVFMMLFAYFFVFRTLGKNYDAAVISAGVCGFGMGATPNAMANIEALTNKFGSSAKAFMVIPIVGGMFVDIFNNLFILIFVNIF